MKWTCQGKTFRIIVFYSIFGEVDFLDLCVFSIFIKASILNSKYVQYGIPNRKSMSKLTQKHNLSTIWPFFVQKKAWCQMLAIWDSPCFLPSLDLYQYANFTKKMLLFFGYQTYMGMKIFKKDVFFWLLGLYGYGNFQKRCCCFWLLGLYGSRLIWVWIRYISFFSQSCIALFRIFQIWHHPLLLLFQNLKYQL